MDRPSESEQRVVSRQHDASATRLSKRANQVLGHHAHQVARQTRKTVHPGQHENVLELVAAAGKAIDHVGPVTEGQRYRPWAGRRPAGRSHIGGRYLL